MADITEKPPVNDGGGLYDSEGLINSLIVDCNSIVGQLISGKYVGFCSLAVQMVQKLGLLKDGMQKDRQSLLDQIAELRKINNDLTEQVTGLPEDRGNEYV